MKLNLLFAASLTLLTFAATAKESKTTQPAAAPEKKDWVSTFKCEKFNGSLGDLKLKMIETCDLDRSFSSSLTRAVAGEDIYLFCCHKSN